MGKQFQYNTAAEGRLEYDGARIVVMDLAVADNTKTYQKGQVVSLSATDTVDYTATGDVPFGIIQVANNPLDPNGDTEAINRVSVRTFGCEVTKGYAKVAVPTVGTLLEADGVHVGDITFTDYQPALSGTWAVAVALEPAILNAQVRVLILQNPVLIP